MLFRSKSSIPPVPDRVQEGIEEYKEETIFQVTEPLEQEQSSYRQIFKATSLFGGVQAFQIFIGVIRTKFVAILLGAAGVGIIGLLNAPLNMIMSITGLGIAFSAVRDVSEANTGGDKTRIAITIQTLRRWSWFTGLLGAVVTAGMAPLLSKWTFGNNQYTWAFVWLSVTLLLQAVSKGQSAILQGMRRLRDMAKAGAFGSAIGLFTSVPLYYFYGTKGIVPAIILISLTALVLSWYFSRKVKTEPVHQTLKQSYIAGLGMVKLGIFITLSGFIASVSTYIINAFISNIDGIRQVGLYNAGWNMVAQYTGLIFTAMATDYFPRLSAVNTDIGKINTLVRQQTETALYIMTPLLALMIVTMPLVIRLLYTAEFIPVVLFTNLTVLGMPLKTISWSMGYIYVAKGDGRLFFTIELIYGLLVLVLNLVGYYFLKLEGIGISFILSFLFGIALSYTILRRKYNFSLSASFWKMSLLTYLFSIAAFSTSLIHNVNFRYLTGVVVFIGATLFSLYHLNKAMDLKTVVLKMIEGFKRK